MADKPISEKERCALYLESLKANAKTKKRAGAGKAAADAGGSPPETRLTAPQRATADYITEQAETERTIVINGKGRKIEKVSRLFDDTGAFYIVLECIKNNVYIKIDKRGRTEHNTRPALGGRQEKE